MDEYECGDEVLGDEIAEAMEEVYGTSDAEDFGEMAEEGQLEEESLANALAEEMDHDELALFTANLLMDR
jgi:hypothetical protein